MIYSFFKNFFISITAFFLLCTNISSSGESFLAPFTEPLKRINLSTTESLTPIPLIKHFVSNDKTKTAKVKMDIPISMPNTKTEKVYLDFKLNEKLNLDAENTLKQVFNLSPNLGYWFDKPSSSGGGSGGGGISIPSFYGGKILFLKDIEDLLITEVPHVPKKPPFVLRMEDFIPVMTTGFGTFDISLKGLFPMVDVDFDVVNDVNIPLEEIFPSSVEPLKLPDKIDFISVDSPDALLDVLDTAVFIVIP